MHYLTFSLAVLFLHGKVTIDSLRSQPWLRQRKSSTTEISLEAAIMKAQPRSSAKTLRCSSVPNVPKDKYI